MTRDRMIEAAAALCGIAGAYMLASKGAHAGWGWVAFLGSNAGWIAFGLLKRHWFLVLQQVGFTYTSLLGIWRWFDGRQLICDHRFDLAQLEQITNGLVQCPCHKCGRVCHGTHGLALPGVFDRNSNARAAK